MSSMWIFSTRISICRYLASLCWCLVLAKYRILCCICWIRLLWLVLYGICWAGVGWGGRGCSRGSLRFRLISAAVGWICRLWHHQVLIWVLHKFKIYFPSPLFLENIQMFLLKELGTVHLDNPLNLQSHKLIKIQQYIEHIPRMCNINFLIFYPNNILLELLNMKISS